MSLHNKYTNLSLSTDIDFSVPLRIVLEKHITTSIEVLLHIQFIQRRRLLKCYKNSTRYVYTDVNVFKHTVIARQIPYHLRPFTSQYIFRLAVGIHGYMKVLQESFHPQIQLGIPLIRLHYLLPVIQCLMSVFLCSGEDSQLCIRQLSRGHELAIGSDSPYSTGFVVQAEC